MTASRTVLTVLICFFLCACSTTGRGPNKQELSGSFETTFTRALNLYLEKERFSAFAVANDSTGHWCYGSGGGYENQTKANFAAIRECRKRRLDFNVESDCKIYAEGENIVNNGKLWGKL